MYDFYQEKSLEHYGVLGMKWGVRRYQNLDGTLTKAGKKRRQKLQVSEIKKRSKRIKNKEDLEKMTAHVMSMSLAELELYNMSPYKRATTERKTLNEALKSAKAGDEKRAKKVHRSYNFRPPVVGYCRWESMV